MAKMIVVVGSINLDLVARTERIPALGETVSGEHFATFFGGKGANQAVAIARLGYPVAMIGKVGNDAIGRQLQEALTEAGVDAASVETVAGSSGVALIATTNRGQNSIIVIPGANGEITAEDLDRHGSLIQGAAMVLTQLEIPMPAIEHLAAMTQEAGAPLILDPAPAQPLSDDLLRRLEWITPNESETRFLLSLADGDLVGEAVIDAAEKLLRRGPRNVLVKLGEQGAFLAEAGGRRAFIPAYKVNAVDSTAAGDAFNGAFAVGLAMSKSPLESARYASAVAALSVTRHGAQPSMANSEEVKRFLDAAITLQ